ncbi:phospho-sugar mutase [Paraclostridium sordellii]|uniref:Phosphoglucomutase n=1 Tax=Paraclostridium sordellii TaxID=1505 RepID=A0A0C7QMS8_PARSO|nr:phospho-sugar mutase [Paeniclostridium sordellii]CEN79733.1 phosphoglucomutase [[Clostridium] sordellii] [Paeniclostridium sordellii]CEO12186.1 phosphoglucomutase [[Clostridium] sordellii] [Paeniclostridium sordellii]CEP87780.1 phosphoglucomutase [[Clostridium] sordellii] [Paeniclostridium sordellii]CEP97484.1 phosphoglucomutase [[Clostridium] sordellii] [Paeniclostridium sordellii]CEQ04821.1 phosphoglucomutase [[Clostridium] sordellii] [Paeniclostridium sordellii]
MKYMDLYKEWTTNLYFDETTRLELMKIEDNISEIEERFYKNLEFGTAGLRGIIGAGTNRINDYTIARATFGLANYIIKNVGEKGKNRGVVIAHDSRYKSREFCIQTANTLAACGIKAYIFDSLRTTPELSYAVRSLNCIAGIVITASHNPPEYNGYKVYWEDGAQVMPDIANKITEEVNKIQDYSKIPTINENQKHLIVMLDENQDTKFIEAVKQQFIGKDIKKDLKIVYTPLCGTGNKPIKRVLNEVGFKNIVLVKEEEHPDSNFADIKYPNPEDKKALERAIKLAKKEDADLVIATDPDCDRVGIAVKVSIGKYELLTGNQIGALLVDYILSNLESKNSIPENSTIIKTIVTSELGARVARSYGVDCLNVLTGFKFIGDKIKEFEMTNEKNFIMGFEESYGYLIGTHSRDKDGVVAAMLIADMASYWKSRGMNLYDALLNLYKKHGYFIEDMISISLSGIEGIKKIEKIMNDFRINNLKEITNIKTLEVKDYEKGIDGLPKSNVLKFILEHDSWIAIRPSGTEPKLKVYIGICGENMESLEAEIFNIKENIEKRIKLL